MTEYLETVHTDPETGKTTVSLRASFTPFELEQIARAKLLTGSTLSVPQMALLSGCAPGPPIPTIPIDPNRYVLLALDTFVTHPELIAAADFKIRTGSLLTVEQIAANAKWQPRSRARRSQL
jgi:hypothetical protein